MKSYLNSLGKYATFAGRASRSEFWIFVAAQILLILVISYLERFFAIANPEVYAGWFTAIFILATLLPSIAVVVRRLHDIGKTGWLSLLLLIPLLGLLIILILALLPGTAGQNRYGQPPR